MAKKIMLTTIDNPHSPFEEFKAWYSWDITAGYHSCSLLGRILVTSPELSDANQEEATERAIDEIIRENVSGVFIKVIKEVPDTSDIDAALSSET